MSIRASRRISLLLAVLFTLFVPFTSIAAPEDYDRTSPQFLAEDHLYGESAAVVDWETGQILFSKNSRVRMYPASTTKIMTLLLAVESGIPFETMVTIPPEANQVPSDGSNVPVYAGEVTSFGDLLYGMMLHSGNDAANALAVLLGGSLSGFAQKMNDRAAELGCEGTHFVNAHGYHDENHYSTAQDLALITRELLKHENARQIVMTSSYTMNISPRGALPLSNTNVLLREGSSYYYEECIGVKTGSHSRAGKCFVGAAEKDGVTLISVTLKCSDDIKKWTDTIRLFNFGFTCYTPYTLEQMFQMTGSRIATVRISNAKEDDPLGGLLSLNIAQVSDPSYERMIQTNSEGAMAAALNDFVSRCVLNITDDLVAPVSAGEIIGTYSYTAQDGHVITASLIASRDIAEQPKPPTIYDLFPFLRVFSNPLVLLLVIVIVLLIVSIVLYNAARRRRIERRRRELYERRRRETQQRHIAERTAKLTPPQRTRISHSARPSTRVPQRNVPRPQGRSTTIRRRSNDDDLFGNY